MIYGTVKKVNGEILTLELDGSAVPVVVRSTAVVTETILSDGGDWFHCLCNNTPDMDGFASCLPDGTEVEPVPDQWDGRHYVCQRCGRVIDRKTLIVTAHTELDP